MVLVPAHQNHGALTIFRDLFSIVFLQGNKAKKKHRKQDPVSTMQKTGWTIHSSFLVLSGLEKGFTLDVKGCEGLNKW